ncbi:N-acetyltransferase [Phenylobacterium aquaticum]|uniref:GNAT family N-acetyltransferase n=1 Tax=Phenylobacterium aquaticum TaxID=1763816 RepID=UPI0026F28AD7|nr:GNAT family N-acetyltransferase [Phenylobacterium aquaticum]
MTPEAIEALRRGAEAPALATHADLEGLAEDLSAAFATDPQFNWFMRDDAQRPAARLKLFRLLMGAIALNDGQVFRPATGGAAAVWIPSETLGPSPLMTELRALPTILAATGLGRFSRMTAMRAAMDHHHPMDRPHVYLWFLGVRPEAQGMGVGSRLLADGLARIDAVGLPSYLESTNAANVPLYRRYGYEVTQEYRPRADAPPIWAMWRDARRGG